MSSENLPLDAWPYPAYYLKSLEFVDKGAEMRVDQLDSLAERAMLRWVLPACFAAASLFCLVLAALAVIQGQHWVGAAVLTTVAIALAQLVVQARQTRA